MRVRALSSKFQPLRLTSRLHSWLDDPVTRATKYESSSAPANESGLTLAQYAAAKALDLPMLEELGLRDGKWHGVPAVQMPYLSQAGRQLVVRYRIALKGDRFRWRKGDTPSLYGLHRLHVARALGFVVLVEGESDCHAAWLHNVPALGIPGSSMWKPFWAEVLAGINDIYLVVEPDQGGQRLIAKLEDAFVGRLHLVQDLGVKDLAELHLVDPLGFVRRFEIAQAKAVCHRSAEQNRSAPAESSSARPKAWRDRRGHVHLPAIEVRL
jgi:hypothetical protein